MKKYYLQVEIRYSIPRDESLDEDDYHQTCFSKFINSDSFNSEKECIAYGNKLIEDNRWMEQYPGYKGLKLTRRYGFPLQAPHLRNGAMIFISVLPLNIHNFDDMNTELRKFNIPIIRKEIK